MTPICKTCEGTGYTDGTPDRNPNAKCPDCKCDGCDTRGHQLIRCATGGEMLCLACHNAETSGGCPVAKEQLNPSDGCVIGGLDNYGSVD